MDEQLELIPRDDIDKCAFPNHSVSTAYRYGCRCDRCMTWKRESADGRSAICIEEGCDKLRIKGRRTCADHAPPARTVIAAEVKKRSWRQADCEIPQCGRTHGWYETQLEANVRADLHELYRRTCAECRKPYTGVIKAHHLNTRRSLQLILATHCDYCHEALLTLPSGRKDVVVDHDHACCEGNSCGNCVRGFVHPHCNTYVGMLEAIIRGPVGVEGSFEYIKAYRMDEPGTPGETNVRRVDFFGGNQK